MIVFLNLTRVFFVNKDGDYLYYCQIQNLQGLIAQSVVSLNADPGVVSSIPARPHISWRLIMKYFHIVIMRMTSKIVIFGILWKIGMESGSALQKI